MRSCSFKFHQRQNELPFVRKPLNGQESSEFLQRIWSLSTSPLPIPKKIQLSFSRPSTALRSLSLVLRTDTSHASFLLSSQNGDPLSPLSTNRLSSVLKADPSPLPTFASRGDHRRKKRSMRLRWVPLTPPPSPPRTVSTDLLLAMRSTRLSDLADI